MNISKLSNDYGNVEGIAEWSRLYRRSITAEEYSEICQNLNGFFAFLQQWQLKETAA